MGKIRRENGAIMLEAMIIVVLTLFLLIWILGIGFLYYQRYLVRIVTNDAASRIASVYYSPESDLILGYIDAPGIKNKELFNSSSLEEFNEERTEKYIQWVLKRSDFPGVVNSVDVDLDLSNDSVFGRTHVKVMTNCEFNTPFGEALTLFGMKRTAEYSVSAYADATNTTDYSMRILLGKALTDGTFLTGTGFVEKAVKMINSFIKLYTHATS